MKISKKLFFLTFLGVAVITCIDPYYPKFETFKSLLVVEGLVTNQNTSYAVKLSRTNKEQNTTPLMVSGAYVKITDDKGISISLAEAEDGIYKTDSLLFKGEVGNSYVLYVKTPDGMEYESDRCTMYPVDKIDNIYFQKDQEIVNNRTVIQDGITIYIDTRISDECQYYRWAYEECWRFKVPYPRRYDYINQDSIVENINVNQYCWKNNISDEIILQSTESGQNNFIEKKPIVFIPSDKSDRLLIRYYIKVKQLSLSQDEFVFWEQMRKINEAGGNIYDILPFPVISNIRNINNPEEQILGYFHVSAVEENAYYISNDEIAALDLPVYSDNCEYIMVSTEDFSIERLTFNQIYRKYVYPGSPFIFVEAIYKLGYLTKLVFTRRTCADCALTGSVTKPDFWID